MPNIDTKNWKADRERERCLRSYDGCSEDYQKHARFADVRMCAHGRVWMCNRASTETNSQGVNSQHWRRLHPVLDFFTYRAAVRAIDAEAVK